MTKGKDGGEKGAVTREPWSNAAHFILLCVFVQPWSLFGPEPP
jgi:hypothetical protein